MSADILGTSWDQCRSMVQYSFTSTETRRLVRTDSPGRPPRLSHSSWTINWCFFCSVPFYVYAPLFLRKTCTYPEKELLRFSYCLCSCICRDINKKRKCMLSCHFTFHVLLLSHPGDITSLCALVRDFFFLSPSPPPPQMPLCPSFYLCARLIMS